VETAAADMIAEAAMIAEAEDMTITAAT